MSADDGVQKAHVLEDLSGGKAYEEMLWCEKRILFADLHKWIGSVGDNDQRVLTRLYESPLYWQVALSVVDDENGGRLVGQVWSNGKPWRVCDPCTVAELDEALP